MIYIRGGIMGPRTKELTLDEETVEVIETIEQCEDYSDLDEDLYFDENDYTVEY